MAGPIPYPESPYPESLPQQPFPPTGPPPASAAYPGGLPPPVEYPKTPRRSRWLVIVLGLLVVAVIAAVVAALILAERRPARAGDTALNPDSAKAAIQQYLDALAQGDDETIARNASCGLFDAIKDKQPDMALAKLASDVFRRQFDSVQVQQVDKIVSLSANQAQALFTMKAKTASASHEAEVDRQSVAQLLVQGNEILVCSYLPRSAGPF
jgi:hypothetical protein